MFLVGLTGGIATGKSTVSTMMKDMGVPVVDADLIARQSKDAMKDLFDTLPFYPSTSISSKSSHLSSYLIAPNFILSFRFYSLLPRIVYSAFYFSLLSQITVSFFCF